MCGIVGYVGYRNAKDVVVNGLKLLEYRGYDSAGIALNLAKLKVFKTSGSVCNLERKLPAIFAHAGIGHTRWATHGKPTQKNAHPHLSFDKSIAIVHNGVIENFVELKKILQDEGISLSSDTDSEIIAHLIALELNRLVANNDDGSYDPTISDMLLAVEQTGKRLKGAASFLALREGDDSVYLFRQGASLAVGCAKGECFVASDSLAISSFTSDVVIVDEGECAVLTKDGAMFFKDGKRITKTPIVLRRSAPPPCSCHMRTEIDEIPLALCRTFKSVFPLLESTKHVLKDKSLLFVGSGTAYHAALYAKKLFSSVNCDAVPASEFDEGLLRDGVAAVFITQSGETADTLRAARAAKDAKIPSVAITNVLGSSITFLADLTLNIDAGAEVAVAATKSYVCQLMALYMAKRAIENDPFSKEELAHLENAANSVLFNDIYEERIRKSKLFFVGRGFDFVTACEGALKFKEITYRLSDAYAAGELKHGPIALIDKKSTVIVIATTPSERIAATVSELKARGAYVLGVSSIGDIDANRTINLPPLSDARLYPIISQIPLQNVALNASIALGLNPDKPRNLAKSVTVI